jgi:hypothetical protein
MGAPMFNIGQEVHIAQKHCAQCRKLETELKHPIRVKTVIPYGDEFTYRVEDAQGAHYEVNECCLCTSPSGHSSSPCVFCGQPITRQPC